MSVPASTTNTNATAAQTALQDAANANFIAAADAAIADSASRGLYLVRVTLFENVNLQTIVTYYQDLGYLVSAPLPPNIGEQPSQLFGEFWEAFWNNQALFFTINGFSTITEIYISWTLIP
jgi:hypothetical protein